LAKDFRSVNLTSFILKTLERFVDRFLKSSPLLSKLWRSLVPFNTLIGRTDWLILFYITLWVEAQLGVKSYALGIFIDIEEAFDSTLNKSIKKAMTKREIAEVLVN